MSKNNWISIANVYVPPHNSTGQQIQLVTDKIPTGNNSRITGDFNGHSLAWGKYNQRTKEERI